jgi:hypothetical protein
MFWRPALLVLLAGAALVGPGQASAAGDPDTFGADIALIPAWRLAPPGYWGGEYTVSSGQHVTVYTSDEFPADEPANQAVANFLAEAVHGPEIETATIYRVTTSQIEQLCGSSQALACYSPDERSIVVPAEDLSGDVSAESALLHEFGHHVAANRLNTPWQAIDWGTKRWASYENVCRDEKRDQVFPGDEGNNYELNPGEGFAEAYRVLNERLLGFPPNNLWVVSRRFFPDSTALDRLRQDVLEPWTARTTSRLAGRLAAGRTRTYRVATPLDGTLSVSGPGGLRLEVLGSSSRLARGTRNVATTICGQRTLRVRATVTSKRALSYRLAITKP